MRVVFSLALLWISNSSIVFFALYLICGLSDVLDGYLARRMHLVSRLGAALDSVADAVFVAVLLFIYIPVLQLPSAICVWIVGIAVIRLITLVLGFYKYHAFAFLHTNLNKITGIALFCFPIFYVLLGIMPTALMLSTIASASAIEELIITIKSKHCNRDVKSILCTTKEKL